MNKIYIDLDGTICDFMGPVLEFREKNKNLSSSNVKYKYPWSVKGFFLDLKPLPLAIESVN